MTTFNESDHPRNQKNGQWANKNTVDDDGDLSDELGDETPQPIQNDRMTRAERKTENQSRVEPGMLMYDVYHRPPRKAYQVVSVTKRKAVVRQVRMEGFFPVGNTFVGEPQSCYTFQESFEDGTTERGVRIGDEEYVWSRELETKRISERIHDPIVKAFIEDVHDDNMADPNTRMSAAAVTRTLSDLLGYSPARAVGSEGGTAADTKRFINLVVENDPSLHLDPAQSEAVEARISRRLDEHGVAIPEDFPRADLANRLVILHEPLWAALR